MKIDLKQFHEHVQGDMKNMGDRCKGMIRTPTPHEPDVEAAAILITALVILRNLASYKVLGPKDLQVAIDAVIEGAGVEEKEFRMGGTYFVRKETK